MGPGPSKRHAAGREIGRPRYAAGPAAPGVCHTPRDPRCQLERGYRSPCTPPPLLPPNARACRRVTRANRGVEVRTVEHGGCGGRGLPPQTLPAIMSITCVRVCRRSPHVTSPGPHGGRPRQPTAREGRGVRLLHAHGACPPGSGAGGPPGRLPRPLCLPRPLLFKSLKLLSLAERKEGEPRAIAPKWHPDL